MKAFTTPRQPLRQDRAHPGRQWGGEDEEAEKAPLSPFPVPHPPLGIRTNHRAAHPSCFEAAGGRTQLPGFVSGPPLRLRGSQGVTTGPPVAFEVMRQGPRKWAVAHPGPEPTPPKGSSPCPLG